MGKIEKTETQKHNTILNESNYDIFFIPDILPVPHVVQIMGYHMGYQSFGVEDSLLFNHAMFKK